MEQAAKDSLPVRRRSRCVEPDAALLEARGPVPAGNRCTPEFPPNPPRPLPGYRPGHLRTCFPRMGSQEGVTMNSRTWELAFWRWDRGLRGRGSTCLARNFRPPFGAEHPMPAILSGFSAQPALVQAEPCLEIGVGQWRAPDFPWQELARPIAHRNTGIVDGLETVWTNLEANPICRPQHTHDLFIRPVNAGAHRGRGVALRASTRRRIPR